MPLVRGKTSAIRRARNPGPAFDAAAPTDHLRDGAPASAGDSASAATLLAALSAEPVAAVRDAIVASLVTNGDGAAAEGLAALIGSEDPALRNLALEGLRSMRADVALPPMLALLGHPDPDRRLLAAGALSAFPIGAVRAALHAILARDAEPNVGLAAVEALSQSGAMEDAAALRAFAARFPDEPMVGFAVRVALGQIGAAP